MAQEQRRLILCGDSVFIAGLEASLRNRPAVIVERVETPLAAVPRDSEDNVPGILIFDLASSDPIDLPLGSLIAALREGIDLLLLGLDSNSSEAVVLTGSRRRILCAEDLNQLLFA